MSLKLRALIGLGVTAIATSAIAVSAGAEVTPNLRAKTVTVKVADDFFAPTQLTIKKGTKVKWKWDRNNTNPHNVVITKKRPKGVKKRDFRSPSGSVGIKWARKFKKPGKYGFICTFHRSVMKMTVTVKRK